jgi:cytochrome c
MRSQQLASAAALFVLFTGAACAQDAAHGKAVFDQKCALCHNADSTDAKIGPGLKGLYARGTMADGTKVTDESVTLRIVNGKAPMPPFKDQLSDVDLKDIVAYLKTL